MTSERPDGPSSLQQLGRHGQIVWLSGMRRRLAESGRLARLIEADGVAGLQLDVDLFAELISCGAEYGEVLRALLAEGRDAGAILDQVLGRDIEISAAALATTHTATDRAGGWVAVNVPGYVERTIDAVGAWFEELSRGAPNVMMKLPATATGLSLAESMLARGNAVCLTHLFSPTHVANALASAARGLRLARTAGRDLGASPVVLSVPLLRIDVAVNEALRDCARSRPDQHDLAESLLGRAGTAVAKVAWNTVREAMAAPRWGDLLTAGAQRPRLAWQASRSIDPTRRELDYIEELVGSDTVSVMTPSMMAAFRDRGTVSPRLGRRLEAAAEVLDDLTTAGLDFDEMANGLQAAGVKHERQRLAALCNLLEASREAGALPVVGGVRFDLAALEAPVAARIEGLDDDFVDRLWAEDPSLWSGDAAEIRNRLGWLHLPEAMREEALPVVALARAGRQKTSAVLLGMGGSSLGAETCRVAYEVGSFTVLDTTVPRGVAAVAGSRDLESSTFVVASKSGTTIETSAMADYFYDRLAASQETAGANFIGITDPGTPLHEEGRNLGYSRVWLSPPDVGGRFSVLSYFGLVPMALMGLDVTAVLGRAARLMALAAPEVDRHANDTLRLGVALAEAAFGGLDKLTFITRPRLSGFADWAEQLVAESLGKLGGGLIPVSGEPPGAANDYGEDRLFIHLRFATEDADTEVAELLTALCSAGHPVIEVTLADPHDLGAEFFRWQLAVAVAGALLGINPFDEPDVRLAKERTSALLAHFEAQGSLPEPAPLYQDDQLAVYADTESDPVLASAAGASLPELLEAHLGRAAIPDYVAVLAFLAPEMEIWHALQGLRMLIRDRLRVATTMGWGPRFLHSTGQLHKGGPDTGLFLQLTAEDAGDLPIPGHAYSFGVLARAQALGDLTALQSCGRRVLRVHLRVSVESGLTALLDAVRGGLGAAVGRRIG